MKSYYFIFILFLVTCKTTPETTFLKEESQFYIKTKKPIKLYGYRFLMPSRFEKKLDDLKAIDLKENIISRETVYKDSIKGEEIHIILHLKPYGKKIYDYYFSFVKNNKAILTNVAGLSAVFYREKLQRNGKGQFLNTIYVRNKYFVLDNDNSCLELIFYSPQKNQSFSNDFQRFIKNISK